ncbi:hypothetical protein ATCC90586_000164 [Pythium insidiosum]|nr:hypothetical protein ATCC90586_000164 [Pythium insidiosum]
MRALENSKTQLIDCRPLIDYLGLTPDSKVSGHVDGSISVPVSDLLDSESSLLLPQDKLIEALELAGVDFTADVIVLGANVLDAALVATALVLAGHTAVSLSSGCLDEEFVSQLPDSLKTSIYDPTELLFQTEEGTFDLSPSASTLCAEEIEAAKVIEREYDEQLRKPDDSTDSDEEDVEASTPSDEVVWVNSTGHRYFDMPRPVDKSLFIATSLDIYRVVSFVLAPFGFPAELSERLSLADIKTRTSSLFQDVIEVCSDLVYHQRGLNEGVMAMSVHKWVEQKRDKECSNQVRAINELLDSLYEPRLVGRNAARDIFRSMIVQHELPTKWLVQSYFDSFEHDVDYSICVPLEVEKNLSADSSTQSAEQLVYRAVHYKRKQEYDHAQASITAAVGREFADETIRAVALNLHASFLYVVGDVHAAVDAISEAIELNPSSVNALVKKGGFLSEVGDMESAQACFDAALELDPNEADVYLHMGQKELLEGKFYEAVQCLRRSISRSEALPVTHVSYGMALYKSGSSYQAVDVFEEAARVFPNSPEVHLFYGEVLADQGDYAGAMKHFLRSFELSPLCPLPFLNAGRVYVSTNDPLRAIAHFEQALAIDPRCSSAHLDIAQVLFAQGRTTEAFEHFDLAARCCRFLPEVEEVCAAKEMARMQERVTDILGVDLRHIMRSK